MTLNRIDDGRLIVPLNDYLLTGRLSAPLNLQLAPVFFIDKPTYWGERKDAPPDRPLQFGHWCHLWTDDGYDNELTAFAGSIGLRADYGQYGGLRHKYHFDLRPRKRRLALQGGAVTREFTDWLDSGTALYPQRTVSLPAGENVYQYNRTVMYRTILKVFKGTVEVISSDGIALVESLRTGAERDYGIAHLHEPPLLLKAGVAGAVIEITERVR